MNKFLSLVSLSLVLFFSACQKESDENTVRPVRSKPVAAPKAPTGRVAGTSAATDLFVLAGDYIYQVSATTRQASIVGSGWSGTEAMTVNSINNCIYGVQGGSLWKYSLTSAVVENLGSNWAGTEAITNNANPSNGTVGYIYAVQGGTLWQAHPSYRSSYSRIGSDWAGTVDMSFVLSQNRIYAIQGNRMWSTNPQGGSSSIINSSVDLNGTVAFAHTGGDYFYVRAGRLYKNGNLLGATDWTGTQAITYAGNYMWIVKNSVVYQVDYGNGNVIATVPGITNAYGVESYECK